MMLSYFATLHLDAYYREVKAVSVDTSPTARKYYRFGKCLIGFSHGKNEGKRIHKLMQVESPDWSECIFREWHLGDLHHERTFEDMGIIIRRISTITETDGWHSEKGFIGAIRKAQAFLWDAELGNQFIIVSNVPLTTD